MNTDRFEAVRAEWVAITRLPALDPDRFDRVKSEADQLIDAGLWTSGPSDMLSVLGRQRDELMHSRLLAWLLVPTNRHGLGRKFVRALLDHLWPGEGVMATGTIRAETEVTAVGPDDAGASCEARADIVLYGDGMAIVIENKLDAGEQADQCDRLYWAWAGEPHETRWVFVSPTGRSPVTATAPAARAAWRTISYGDIRTLLTAVLAENGSSAPGRATATQYLATLTRTIT